MWWYGKCRSNARLDGKTAIITGCNTGIGKYNVLDFCRRGCRVIMACRSVEKAEEARADVLKQLEATPAEGKLGEVVIRKLDLSSLQSVRDFVATILSEEDKIELLINNAGVMMCPLSRTADGFEMQLGTNHLGHFLLTLLLLPRLIKSAPSRVVNVSSSAHSFGEMDFDDLNWEKTPYSAIKAYGRSKLANVLFTKELALRLEGTGVTTYALHPGVVSTDLARHLDDVYFTGIRTMFRVLAAPFWKNPEQGAQTQIHCAVDEKAGEETGLYYSDCKVTSPESKAKDQQAATRLWEESCLLVKIGDHNSFTPK